MHLLQLTNGQQALVDDIDWMLCLAHIPWHVGAKGYVMTSKKGQTRTTQQSYYLHVLIAQAMKIEVGNGEIDHKDGNKLNCTRSNLRWASNAQNQMNRDVRLDSSTQVKGVNLTKGKYQAYIIVNYKKIHLGTFNSLIEARSARLKAEKLHFGTFRRE